MSIKVMNRIWERSQNKGSALLLLLAIADHAHDDGGGAYPSVPALARKVRMSARAVRLLLQKLIESGELEIQAGAGPKGANLYRINLNSLRGEKISPPTPEKIAGATPEKISPPGVKRFQGEKISGVKFSASGGEKIAGEGVKNPAAHIRKEPSCRTVMEPSLQQQAGLSDGCLPAAAAANSDFAKSQVSRFSRAEIEQFIIETKLHSHNPGGLATRFLRTGEEDAAIEQWKERQAMKGKEIVWPKWVFVEGDVEANKRLHLQMVAEQRRQETSFSGAEAEAFMGQWIDKLIADCWTLQPENECKQIMERGGPKAPWEHRVIAYFNNRAASDAA